MKDILYFVLPCYYDEEVLPVTVPAVLKKLDELTARGGIGEESRVLLVNDGSEDGTWDVIRALHGADARVIGIDLCYNSGERNALMAGMYFAADKADCVITIDSDLQDDLDAADEMVQKYNAGSDIVLGVRSDRSADSLRERFFSKCFYICMRLLKTGQVPQHSNYRLMSRKAVEALFRQADGAFFLPAIVSSLGLPYQTAAYRRAPRTAGQSRYNFRKKFTLAVNAMLLHSRNLPFLISLAAAVSGVLTGLFAALWAVYRIGALLAAACVCLCLFLLFAGFRLGFGRLCRAINEKQRKPWFEIREEII